MAVALSSDGCFGFGLQIEKGTYVAPTTWFPLIEWETQSAADTVE